MRFSLPTYTGLLFFVFFICLRPNPVYGQEEQTTYLNKQHQAVSNSDSAVYIRILTPSETPQAPYRLTEKYKTGELYREGYTHLDGKRLLLTGMIKTYQQDGKKISEERFQNGVPVGLCRYYYQNGQLKCEFMRPAPPRQRGPILNPQPVKMQVFYDSLGTQLVNDGNGYVKDIQDSGDVEEGTYQDGYKEGVWKGSFMKHRYSYVEEYKGGKLLGGTTTDEQGKTVTYEVENVQPSYPGGIGALYRFIGQNYHYPTAARRAGVKGSVVMKFVIDRDGKVTDTEVVRDLGYGTGKEGERVLRKAKRWNPGTMRGITVRVAYSLPIKLN